MSGGSSLVSRYDAVVCDLDGVVYRGPTAVPHAVEVLSTLDRPRRLRDQQRLTPSRGRGGAPACAGPGLRAHGGRDELAGGRLAAVGAGRAGQRRPRRRWTGCRRRPRRGRARPGGRRGRCRQLGARGGAPGVRRRGHRSRPGRGGVCRGARRHLGRDQHRRHPADGPWRGAGQRGARRCRRTCRRPTPRPRGGQAGSAALPACAPTASASTRVGCWRSGTDSTPTSRVPWPPAWTRCSC